MNAGDSCGSRDVAGHQSPGQRQAAGPNRVLRDPAGRPDNAALDQRELRERLHQRLRCRRIAVVIRFGQVGEAGFQQRSEDGAVGKRFRDEVVQAG